MSRLNLKANPDNPVEVAILEYLDANASDSLAERINAGKKTIKGCFLYIERQALEKIANDKRHGNVCVPMPREEVFGQAIHYFEEDDIKEVEEPKPTASPSASTAPVSAAPVKAKRGSRTKVVAVEPTKSGGIDLDSMLSDLNIEVVGEEKKPEPAAPEPQPEAPPAPEERKEPQQMDWLAEFGISV